MNHLIDSDNGTHSFSPYYRGEGDEHVYYVTCAVCEYQREQGNCASVEDLHICAGCARSFDPVDYFALDRVKDAEQIKRNLEALKPFQPQLTEMELQIINSI